MELTECRSIFLRINLILTIQKFIDVLHKTGPPPMANRLSPPILLRRQGNGQHRVKHSSLIFCAAAVLFSVDPMRASAQTDAHQLFAVADYTGQPVDIEAGIGFGLTNATDDLTLKLIVSRDLN